MNKYINPYSEINNGRWIKVNFHTHAGTGLDTCGRNSVVDVVKLYRELGFGGLCISNHDLYTDTKFFGDKDFISIPGVEYSQDRHMLTIGVEESLHDLNHQNAINETLKQDGFVILCHPNWIEKGYWDEIDALKLKGYLGIEVMNMLIYRLSGSGRATDLWDKILKSGRYIYGFANDDFHMPYDAGKSYNDVFVENGNLSWNKIRNSIKSGKFIASTGLRLKYFKIVDNVIKVCAQFNINTYLTKFHYYFFSERGCVKSEYNDFSEYLLNDERYIRVEVVSENGFMLFTQPVYRQD